jgi:hypothetical protein
MAYKSKATERFKQNPRNHNKGTERGTSAIANSFERLGAGRSGLCDKNEVMIAGNHALEAANRLGLKVRVVETEGDEFVIVKRKDLDLAVDGKAVELAYADNRTASLNWDLDAEQLAADINDGVDLSVSFSKDELTEILEEAGNVPAEKKSIVKIRLSQEEREEFDRLVIQLGRAMDIAGTSAVVLEALRSCARESD